jgi:hypothetical protein
MATTDSLCLVSDNRQEVLTWTQINEMRKEIDIDNADRSDSYPTISSLITADPLRIDQQTMQSITDELQQATRDPSFISGVQDIATLMRRPLIM